MILRRLESWLYSEGWRWIIPYLVIYLGFRVTGTPVATLTHVFQALHLLNFAGFLHFAFQRRSGMTRSNLLFWGAIAIALWIPGAYLEYPSDPWEHFFRIHLWQAEPTVGAHPYWTKFGYFLHWSFISWANPLQKRWTLDLLSAGWQLLWASQIYRFARALGFNSRWSRVQVLAAFALFGHNFHSHRYYALSTTLIAHFACLAALIRTVPLLARKESLSRRTLVDICLLLALMLINHLQELLLFAVSTTGLALPLLSERVPARKLRSLLLCFAGFGVISALVFKWIGHRHAGWYPPQLRSALEQRYLSSWGLLRVWDPHSHAFMTLGASGILALVFAIALIRKGRRLELSTASLLPFALLIFPPFVIAFASVTLPETLYRLLYAFPLSFAFVAGFEAFSMPGLAALAVIAAGLVPQAPLYGRLFFQLYRVPDAQALRTVDPVAQWFYEHPELQPHQVYIPDAPTQYLVMTELDPAHADYARAMRFNRAQQLWELAQPGGMPRWVERHYCGALFPPASPPMPESFFGKLSGYWNPHIADVSYQTSPEYRETEAIYVGPLAWKRIELPGGYRLYLAPSAADCRKTGSHAPY